MKKHPKHLSLQDLPLTLSAAHLTEIPGHLAGDGLFLDEAAGFPADSVRKAHACLSRALFRMA